MFEKLIPIIQNSSKIGIFTHMNPDGDAMGSSYALKNALNSNGKKAEVFLCKSPDGAAWDLILKGEKTNIKKEDCDLLIAMDSGDSKRLGEHEEFFMSHPNTIAIDHHKTHVEYANKGTVFTDISSTCELTVVLLKEMGIEITKDIAHNAYIGLVTDTGNFKFSSITGNTLRIAAELIDTGIEFAEMSKRLFDTKSKGYYALLKIALDKLGLYCDNKLAIIYLSNEDYTAANIDEADSIGIVNIPNSIEGVEVGAFIRKRNDGEYKVSLRSNRYVDVAEIAVSFGGGGHIRAGGYVVREKTVDEIISELIKEVEKVL